jgi:hypothetical protein
MANIFGTVSACVGMGSTCISCGPSSLFGVGAVEGQDPQVVHVKGFEVAWDLVVECHGWPRAVQQQQYHQLYCIILVLFNPKIDNYRLNLSGYGHMA